VNHNTHIYLAAKAIELTKQSVDNLRDGRDNYVYGKEKRRERAAATHRQRLFQAHEHFIEEASWAPDDVLRDNKPFHIFKLFTDDEFPEHGLTDRQQFTRDGVTYYKFSGGLAFRVDHLARSIAAMWKLRDYNDQFSLKQILYQYLLMSHYVVDAHVPLHCDLRDDRPSDYRSSDPTRELKGSKPSGRYLGKKAHSNLESLWNDAVTYVAVRENILGETWKKECVEPNELVNAVTFTFDDCKRGGEISVVKIPEHGLMDFMIDICITSKIHSRRLFPVENPVERNDDILEEITREIFANCIGNLLSVWRYVWIHNLE